MVARSWWILALPLGGCGTETGNPELLALSYNARTTDPGQVELGTKAGVVSTDAVWLRLGPVDIRGDCGDQPVKSTFQGLGFANHAEPAPATQAFDVPAHTVCRLTTDFEPDPAATGEAPDVEGTAMGLVGTLSDGRGFEVIVDERVPLDFALDDAPIPTDASWLVSFDVATWLDADAMDALVGDPVAVSANANAEVYAAFMARVRQGVALNLDEDQNGQVDPGEPRLDE